MKGVFYLIIVLLLAGGAYWLWGSSNQREGGTSVVGREKQENEKIEPHDSQRTPSGSETYPTSDLPPPPVPLPPSHPKASEQNFLGEQNKEEFNNGRAGKVVSTGNPKKDGAEPEQITFVENAKVWMKQVRKIMGEIEILLLLAQGYPESQVFGESVSPPNIDIAGDLEELNRMMDALDFLGSCSDAKDIFKSGQDIVINTAEDLSDTSTIEELEEAHNKMEQFRIGDLNQIYSVINGYCQ